MAPKCRCGRSDAWRAHHNHSCVICESVHNHAYRARQFGLLSDLTSADIWYQIESQGYRCYWCNDIIEPVDCAVDHLLALSCGGANTAGNIVISCHECNHHKSRTDIYKWLSKLSRDSSELAWVLAEQHRIALPARPPQVRKRKVSKRNMQRELEETISRLEKEVKSERSLLQEKREQVESLSTELEKAQERIRELYREQGRLEAIQEASLIAVERSVR